MNLNLENSKFLKDFKPGLKIFVKDLMQEGYEYQLSKPLGKDFDIEFKPELSPCEMLEYGIFEGKYLNDCVCEFPREWYESALKKNKLSNAPDLDKNYFKIKSRQPRSTWLENTWITPNDPDVRGWFHWYCRYYLGRRDAKLDQRQIKRWRSFARHRGQVVKNCEKGNLYCRPKQRQALLQWAYTPFI